MTPFLLIPIASSVAMIVAVAWYSPLGFGKRWERLQGLHLETKKDYQAYHLAMIPKHIASFFLTMVISWTLWAVLGLMGISKLPGALLFATILWAGLVVPGTLSLSLYDNKSLKLWVIDVGQAYASMLAITIVLQILR